MGTMERDRDGPPDRELYALLHLSPEASDDDVKRAYRQWAQVYHPDKHQTLQMQDIATQNFQKIREAYEILSDERKRQIYDLYGMEGLTSGLELGPKLKSREEVRAEFERLQQRQEERKLAAHVHHRGSLLMNLSLVPFLQSYDAPRISGMAMSTQVQAQVSKRDTMVLGGNMALRRGIGGGSGTVVLRRQLSPISTVEVLAMVGLRSILSLQTSRQLSSHSTGTLGLSVSLRDGSVTLANTWSRQLSEDTTGNIQLVIGPDTGLSVGWQRHGKKNAGSADVKVGPAAFGVSGQYIRHFSSKSQGRVTGKIGSTGVEVELGGERRLSEHSSAAMFCVLGLQGISWKIRFTRGGQKFVIPIMLCPTLNPFIATGALIIPSSIYAILKTYVFKPYNLRRNRRKSLELRRTTYAQVMEARASSDKSQLLLKNVAERKKQKQAQRQGLVILAATYGDIKAYERGTNFVDKSASTEDDDADLPPPYLDVAIPVQFLVDDFGQLRLHEGVKKAGLMGFCDPCPGEAKQLKVAYSYLGHQYEVVVGDYDELRIPQEAHRIQRAAPEKLDQSYFLFTRVQDAHFAGPSGYLHQLPFSRSSFWLQYGRLRQHLQACDVLLEQINACAALPGRPKLEIPAGISREVRTNNCEIPFSATPQSPFDALLNLSFDTPRAVYPDPESPDTRLKLVGDPLIRPPGLEECSSLDSQPQSPVSLPKSESQVFSVVSQASPVQVLDVGEDVCGSLENGPDLCNCEFKPLQSSPPKTVVAPLACVSGSEDVVRKGSVSAPENPPPRRPINFISASYYVERPSNPKSSSPGNSTRRTSFCRIEAFVVRSKSVKPRPLQHRVGVPEFKN